MADVTDTVTLGGVAYPVLTLPTKQLKHLVPRLVSVLRVMGPSSFDLKKAKDEGRELAFDEIMQFLGLPEEQIENLTTLAFVLIQKGTPTLTRAEYDELPITLLDLFNALPMAMKSTGLFGDGTQQKEPVPGEAQPPTPLPPLQP